MGVHMAPRSQYEHIVFPRLRLGVLWSFQRFPPVAPVPDCLESCGGAGVASPAGWKRLQHVLSAARQPAPAYSFHLSTPHPPQEGLLAETGGLILPWSARQLYPPDKALGVPSQSWVKPLLLSCVWCLWCSCGLPQRRPGHRHRHIQPDHRWWYRKTVVRWTIKWQKNVSTKSAPSLSLHSVHKSTQTCTSPFRASAT